MNLRSHYLLLVALLLVGCASPQTNYSPATPAVRLIDSMTERLEISREVAWAKYRKNSAINDPAREAAVLASLESQGRQMGLSDLAVESLFKPQFTASKRVQEELIAGWQSGRPMPSTPPKDLQKDIRPALDKISHEMLVELKDIQRQSLTPQFERYAEIEFHRRGFSWKASRLAAKPLGKINSVGAGH